MLLIHTYPHEPPIASTTMSFASLRSEKGGLKLALHCLTWRCWLSVNVLFFAGQPLWTWFSDLVRSVKTPQDGLNRTIWLAQNWRHDDQFKNLIAVFSATDFASMEQYLELSVTHVKPDSTCNMESFVEELFFYVLSLLEKRSSSLSKMNCPPDIYAGLLSEDDDLAQQALDMLLSDWKALTILEQSPAHQILAGDLRVSVPPVMRLVYQLCEQGLHTKAKKMLKSLLHVLPDTKLIEDIHGKVHNDARMNINKKQNNFQIQQIITGSSVLEARKINHPASLSKDLFKLRWKRTKGSSHFKSCFNPKSSKLPKKYSGILGGKKWGTVSEESLHRSSSAWQLVRYFVGKDLKTKRISLTDALLCLA
jgi:hypothetical protein